MDICRWGFDLSITRYLVLPWEIPQAPNKAHLSNENTAIYDMGLKKHPKDRIWDQQPQEIILIRRVRTATLVQSPTPISKTRGRENQKCPRRPDTILASYQNPRLTLAYRGLLGSPQNPSLRSRRRLLQWC